jgi:hypothetical protein
MPSHEELEELYGPAASYLEHHRGDHIRYHLAGEPGEYVGTIIWVCAHFFLSYRTQDLWAV